MCVCVCVWCVCVCVVCVCVCGVCVCGVCGVCVCVVCVYVCSRLAATSFVRSQPKSARTEEGLRKNKKIMHRVPSRGIDPRVKFLDDANATHCSSFEHTPAPVPCRLYASSSFAKLRAIEYLLPTKLTLLALSFLFKF